MTVEEMIPTVQVICFIDFIILSMNCIDSLQNARAQDGPAKHLHAASKVKHSEVEQESVLPRVSEQ